MAAEMPAGDAGVAQGIGHAMLVPGCAVQDPRLLEIGEGLAVTAGGGVCPPDLVEGTRLTAPVTLGPVDRRGVLGQGKRLLVPAGLLAHLAEFQGRLRDPARIRDVAGCL